MKKTVLLLLAVLLLFSAVSCNQEAEEPKAAFANAVVNGVEIAIDDEAASVLSALGKEILYEESPSCAFEGMDKIYLYSGFSVQTYTKGGKDYIRSLELLDDSQSTKEGIAIGASESDVIAKYGTASAQTATSIQYTNAQKGVTLQFILRNGSVTNIQYLKNED